ncbi:hypothetical protein KBTX_03271 [wastewater metagenome]|uniref:Glycosyltransferase 2-like domain-containing protein n=2 Tax=unclassified sequences TaxID=12908 RepID=A0A5B8RGE0_9ZZZZ|nr:glycosyltransferase family 2 protein [Arhodomonas sp. KWT]QEA06928.1 hypothetical protein KBTEX_03271 [uncultured organism]
MLNETPTVSVICHAFNHEAFIRQALEGILMQETDFAVEVIVHDDASTDRTAAIIREVAKEHDGQVLPILQEENQFSRGRRPKRFTYPKARGEFIALCEGDDYWTDPRKLQKQVDALRRHPEIDLCVHPAMRLSMRTGKQKKGFDHGPVETIVPVEKVIARHNQFAPTASVLMRREAAQAMPSWWLHGTPPTGDFFIEAIVGRPGVLYLPETMSVYRRGVPGSYTNRFNRSEGQILEQSLERMLHFTERLRRMPGIPEPALNQRLAYVRLNYALQFLAWGDRERYTEVSRHIRLKGQRLPQLVLALMRGNRLAFQLGRRAFLLLRQLRP